MIGHLSITNYQAAKLIGMTQSNLNMYLQDKRELKFSKLIEFAMVLDFEIQVVGKPIEYPNPIS